MPLEIQNPSRIPKDFAIFYCWQDHLAKRRHRYLIRTALTNAINRVQAELPDNVDCTLRLDSDTDGRAGAVDIANTILSKIAESTMLVGDVTPCLHDAVNGRFYPNPNVMFEIGYGAKALGWSRIVCLFNAGNAADDQRLSAEDIPFDIRHRRLNSYVCRADSGIAQAIRDLESDLVASIRAVIGEIDRGEFDPALGNAVLKRARDIELLRQLLSTIHRTTMDRIIERGTVNNVHYDGLLFWEGFSAVMNSAHFRFYDKNLETLARKLHDIWEEAVDLGGIVLYPNDCTAGYSLLPERQWSKDYGKRVAAMGKAYASMPGAFKAFLDYVHEHYPEIDFNVTDAAAWQDNLPYMTATLKKQTSKKSNATTVNKAKQKAPKKASPKVSKKAAKQATAKVARKGAKKASAK